MSTPAPTILLADDDAMLRRLIRLTLGREPFELLEAADGNEALALGRAHRPDVALLDVNMPGPDGLEVCRLLKSDPSTSGIRVLMLTARAADRDLARGRECGADRYMTKPFSPRELLDEVNALLGTP